ncbi:TetR/AcrR family transcriptional regulator [Pseudomonas sp.]|uniref:TetR/AcrR family transcriptional regulator n=1 Tax=Pseudomonas sp. TaxID=306 RepID=UPI00299CE38E|nr:TetR/AcrR family transcriptional regulator [Pseudomonas sp.]MDX1368605.1 TetR/AcrR family transcriptional regulator [Pseudomonas sp.]
MSTCKQSQPYHHGELKPALLAAAAQLLDEGGVALISLREVARRAGVSHNAPYRHFADRDSLLAALAEDGFRELGRRMDAETGGLAALGQCYVYFALEQPGRFALMFGAGLDKARYPQLQQAALALYQRLALAVHETAPAREPEVATLAAWSLVHGLAQLLLDRQLSEAVQGGLSAAELSERVTRMFANGLQGG